MQRLTFILLLAIAATQYSTAVESTSTNNVGQLTPNFDFTQHDRQQSSNHRELSSTSAYSTNNGVGYFFATLWYNIQMHLGPDCHHHGPGHGHCPCGPPHDPNKCHHSSTSSSSSGGGRGSGGSSSGTSQTSSSSGGGSSSSSSTSSSSSSNWENDGYSSDGTSQYGSYNDDKWTDDGWNSNNLDNGGSAAGTTFIGTAKSIAPFLIGALVAGFIGAAFVVMRKKRQDEDAHPLEGSLKKRMKLFSGGVFRKKSMLDDDLEEGGGAEQQQPSFVEISSVNEHSHQIGASTYESNAAYTAPNMSMQSNSSYVAPNMSMQSNNVYAAPQMSNVSEFHNEDDDNSEIDSEMGDF